MARPDPIDGLDGILDKAPSAFPRVVNQLIDGRLGLGKTGDPRRATPETLELECQRTGGASRSDTTSLICSTLLQNVG